MGVLANLPEGGRGGAEEGGVGHLNGDVEGRVVDSSPCLDGGRLCAGGGDGSPHPRGQREGARE